MNLDELRGYIKEGKKIPQDMPQCSKKLLEAIRKSYIKDNK